ncbi:MAG: transcriptional repressor LexA [Treponema sp.]|jgi:repressor LexA|nr:transcriptional repressor LexA [Treponema sp.]
MKELTKRQQEILSFIIASMKNHSYPPTIREIADNFSISVKGAYDHITALKRKNYLKQDGKRSRALKLIHSKTDEDLDAGTMSKIPIVGTVAAGIPILSEENWEGTISLHQSTLKKNRTYFAVTVRGDSMSGAGIMDGDMAIIEKLSVVKNGEIAVAVIDDAVTLKRFYRESARIRLQAENPDYKPIYCRDVRILGRLAQIIRLYK